MAQAAATGKLHFSSVANDCLPGWVPLQAFYLARTGRPGPVLVDVPKDVQQQLAVPDWDVSMAISGYMSRLPQQPRQDQVSAVIDALHQVGLPVCPPEPLAGAEALANILTQPQNSQMQVLEDVPAGHACWHDGSGRI